LVGTSIKSGKGTGVLGISVFLDPTIQACGWSNRRKPRKSSEERKDIENKRKEGNKIREREKRLRRKRTTRS
jgi:hypothetical protein